MMVILLLGSVVSILALMVISPTIAWIYLGFWILIFPLMFYKNRKELCQMIPKRIKNVINGMSSHNLEMSGVESFSV
jgi:arginyl-tRNA--protein-N-Asp/Glu arginylyltransferase